ncbi:hydrolase [Bradyrhizobium sp. WD16]|nr:HAD-IA family hydrolase [Bradyrhizobium sp. WD16]UTD27161.1 hydrolase [Bradyrhizobium sp. WD16]
MHPRRAGLVIFDCDGVLVDSEPISCRVHAQVLSRHGYPITAEEVRQRFLGRSARDANREVEAELGRALPEACDRERRRELLEALAREVTAVPHIHDILDRLTLPACVASSGAHDKIFTTLSRTNLHARFAPHIFSASEVARGKPAPDLFLFAAARMDRRPEDCLVVEDSVAGVTAAVAAGMGVIGYIGGSHCRPSDAGRLSAAGAPVVIDDMRELPALVASHFAGPSSLQ